MNTRTESRRRRSRKERWIAAGFIGAFAASIGTVIYTGLRVDGYVGEFQAGFRAVTMSVGESRSVELTFNVPMATDAARLELTLPDCLNPADGRGVSRPVQLVRGVNEMTLELVATGECSGYMYARVIADEPLDLERIFITVESG